MFLRTLFTLLVSWVVSTAALAQGNYDHVVIVLDASGSMTSTFGDGQSKMAAAKSALKQVLANTSSDTRIGLLVFGKHSGWAYPLDRRDDAKLNAAIEGMNPSGGTPLGSHLKIAADALLAARAEQHGYGTYRLLVVTDGKAGDQELVKKSTPLLLDRGLGLDVIGVHMKDDHMLKGVAHTYRSADDPRSLTEAVRQVFAEVSVGDGDVGADAFEVLEGLPDSFALASIEALAMSPALNHPLDTRPVTPRDPSEPGSGKRPVPPPSVEYSCAHSPGPSVAWLLTLLLLRRRV